MVDLENRRKDKPTEAEVVAINNFYCYGGDGASLAQWASLGISITLPIWYRFWSTWAISYVIDSFDTAIVDSLTPLWSNTYTITIKEDAAVWQHFTAIRVTATDAAWNICKFTYGVFVSVVEEEERW